MSYQLTISGHVDDPAQVDAINESIKQEAVSFVQTLVDAGVPVSTASLNLPSSDASVPGTSVDLLDQATNPTSSGTASDGAQSSSSE